MKHIAAFILLAFIGATSLAAQLSVNPTRYIAQYTPSSSMPLANDELTYQYLDNNGNVYHRRSDRWDGDSWELGSKTFYTLNSDGNWEGALTQYWDTLSADWDDRERQMFQYDNQGRQTLRKNEIRDLNTNSWTIRNAYTQSYTPTGKVLQTTNEFYSSGMLYSAYRQNYTYDANDRVSEYITETREPQSGLWEKAQKTTYQYNSSSEDYTALVSLWSNSLLLWNPAFQRLTRTSNLTTAVTLTESINSNGTFSPVSRVTIVGNADGQTVDNFTESWDTNTSTWMPSSQFTYIYNSDKSLAQFNYWRSDFVTDQFFKTFQVDYDYGAYVGNQTPVLNADIQISPNPTTDIVRVQLKGQTEAKTTRYILTDAQGALVARETSVASAHEISLVGLPAGLYFLRVEQGGAAQVTPVVKQ